MTFFVIAVAVGVIFFLVKSLLEAGTGGARVVVKTYKGNKAAERGIRQMLAKGYEIQGQSSRKVLYSLTTGVFTRKQKHTITFVKAAEAPAQVEAAQPDVVGQPDD